MTCQRVGARETKHDAKQAKLMLSTNFSSDSNNEEMPVVDINNIEYFLDDYSNEGQTAML